MCDDGGSTGILRDELGVLPPGDARQCLVALSENDEIRNLFSYRFSAGSLSGQSLGNIILSGLELQHGSFETAVQVASKILRIRGRVVPVALGPHKLALTDGYTQVLGQHKIEHHSLVDPKARVRLEPASRVNPKAEQAIREADMVIIAPGSFYTSLLPVMSVNGVAEALQETQATVVMVANLVNKPLHTKDWHIADYVAKLSEYIGQGQVDTVLYNTEPIAKMLLKKYAEDNEFPVRADQHGFAGCNVAVMGMPLVSNVLAAQDPADKAVRRTLIRHDPWKVKECIEQLLVVTTAKKKPSKI
jgi:uncharacterized cofD-like protein